MKARAPLTQIGFADAIRIVLDAAAPIELTETLPIERADGRVVAQDVTAAVDVPPFDRAAMDGYAVIAADTTDATAVEPRTLSCVGRVFTGQTPTRGISRGECIAIATGAPMPDGADAVVMVEDTESVGAEVRIRSNVQPRQNVGRRAADIGAGQTVVARGQLLGPSRVGALAATGVTSVEVYAQPSVAIMSTGNEIADPGQPLMPGQIYDINRFTLEAVVRRHGGVAVAMPAAGDTIDELSRALDAARACDIIVFSGGSSIGERDLMVDALQRHGEVRFHGIAVKPGKPTLFGFVGGTPIFGMPGYPTSCLSNAYMLLLPFLRKVAQLPPWRPETMDVPLARRIVSATGRHQFYTVRIVNGHAEPAFKASGDITSMANADGYIEIPAATDIVEAGTSVKVTLFS